MTTDQITPARLRRLAEVRPDQGMVVSLFLDLDPSEFSTPPARATAVASLITEANHRADAVAGLDPAQKAALHSDVDRARDALESAIADGNGTRALAVYCCSPADLLEVVHLPEPVESRVVIERTPHVEPLAAVGVPDTWCVVLVNRRIARIICGTPHDLDEVSRIEDDVSGQHDQGGRSQRRFERGIEKEVHDHLGHVADDLFAAHRRSALDHLIVGAPEELAAEFEARLHPYLRERIAGRLHVDVEHTPIAEVRAAAARVVEDHETARERATLDHLAEAVARAERGAAGLADTLRALNEQRVDTLLVAAGHRAGGACCPACGLLATSGGTCPVDGTPLEDREDIVGAAIERATVQAAAVLVVRRHDDLGPLGGIGAILRF